MRAKELFTTSSHEMLFFMVVTSADSGRTPYLSVLRLTDRVKRRATSPVL
jgi:hypothetical protein